MKRRMKSVANDYSEPENELNINGLSVILTAITFEFLILLL